MGTSPDFKNVATCSQDVFFFEIYRNIEVLKVKPEGRTPPEEEEEEEEKT